MITFTRKGYGRIYVELEEDIAKVDEIIKTMDAFEWEYLPKKMIAVFTEYPKVIYTHKFDSLDLNALTAICWAHSIKIWCFDSNMAEFPKDATKDVK